MYALLLANNPDQEAVLSLVLRRAGLAVTTSNDLENALRIWSERPEDIIVLAIQGDPLAHLGRLRAEIIVPVVVIVNQLSQDTHLALLQAGADLVIQQDFSATLLIGQIRALLRRTGSVPFFNLPTLIAGELALDPSSRTVRISNGPVRRLTHLEFRLLHSLMNHQGQILPTTTIVHQVWGFSGEGEKELVRGLIHRLRTKVEPDPGNPQYILTIPGIGYTLTEPRE